MKWVPRPLGKGRRRDTSMIIASTTVTPIAPLSQPRPQAPSTPIPPAKPLVRSESTAFVASEHVPGVIHEPAKPLSAHATCRVPDLSPAERPPLSAVQRRAQEVYAMVGDFVS